MSKAVEWKHMATSRWQTKWLHPYWCHEDEDPKRYSGFAHTLTRASCVIRVFAWVPHRIRPVACHNLLIVLSQLKHAIRYNTRQICAVQEIITLYPWFLIQIRNCKLHDWQTRSAGTDNSNFSCKLNMLNSFRPCFKFKTEINQNGQT